MPINIGDVLRINANMLLDAISDVQNIWHFTWDGTDGISDDLAMDQIASAIDVGYQIINPNISVAITYVNLTGQNITKAVLLPTKTWPTLVAGLDGGQLLPPETYAQVFFRTTRPKTRASKRMGGYTETNNTLNGNILIGAQAVLQAFGDNAVAGFPDVVARLKYGAYNKPLDRFTPVNAAVAQAEWRSLKRRRRASGS